MVHQKLISQRKAKGLSQEQMAQIISMEQTTYSRKERGKSPVTNDEWERFAKALDVPVEDIKEEQAINIKNENCTFNESNVGTFNNRAIGIQYVNIPQNILDIIIRYNEKLEQENETLRKELKKQP